MHDLFDDQHKRYYYEELGSTERVTLYVRTLSGYPASGNYFHSLREHIKPLDIELISTKRLNTGGVRLRETPDGVYRVGSPELWNPLNSVEQAIAVATAFNMDILRKSRSRIVATVNDRFAVANYIDFNDSTRSYAGNDSVVYGKALCHAVVALAIFLSEQTKSRAV